MEGFGFAADLPAEFKSPDPTTYFYEGRTRVARHEHQRLSLIEDGWHYTSRDYLDLGTQFADAMHRLRGGK